MSNRRKYELPILADRHRIDHHLSRLANRLRLGGYVTAALALVVIMSLQESSHPHTDLATVSMIAFGAVGFGIAIAGDLFWRSMKAHTTVDEREF